jgi:glycolate oxidase FAD binding subunit
MSLQLLRSSLQPLAADLLSPSAAAAVGLQGAGWTLAVLVGGVANAVRRQVDDLGRLARESGSSGSDDLGTAGDGFWDRVTALGEEAASLAVKATAPIPSVAAATGVMGSIAPELGEPVIWSRAGSGIVHARWESTAKAGALVEALAEARRTIVGLGGALVIERAPAGVRDRLDVWGDVGGAVGPMRALKAQFDPRGTLNPGRFVGGI